MASLLLNILLYLLFFIYACLKLGSFSCSKTGGLVGETKFFSHNYFQNNQFEGCAYFYTSKMFLNGITETAISCPFETGHISLSLSYFNFNSFTLSLNESDSFKIFCVEVFMNFKSFKFTRGFTSNFLEVPLTSNQTVSMRPFVWMDGCAKVRIIVIYLIIVVRTFNPINVTVSHYLFKVSSMPLARKQRRKFQFARVLNRLLSKLFYLSLLLLMSGDIHSNPGPIFRRLQRHPSTQGIVVGAWNVRTLLEKKRSHVRPTAIVGRTLKSYNIDICALSETRLSGENIISEQGAGYTFFSERSA